MDHSRLRVAPKCEDYLRYRNALIDNGSLNPNPTPRPEVPRPYLPQDDWGLRAAAWDMRRNGYSVPEEWRKFLDAIDS